MGALFVRSSGLRGLAVAVAALALGGGVARARPADGGLEPVTAPTTTGPATTAEDTAAPTTTAVDTPPPDTTTATTTATTTTATTTTTTTTSDAAPTPVRADAAEGALAGLQMGSFRVQSASPGGRRLGVGLSLGWPTGVDAQLQLRPHHGVRVGVGAFTGLAYTEPAVSLRADWLWFPVTVARAPAFRLHAHVGAGAGVVVLSLPDKRTSLPAALWYRGRTQLWTAARVPLGVNLALEHAPVDLVFDVVPTALVFPGFALGADVALGARVWF
jgi:hypothetical protein